MIASAMTPEPTVAIVRPAREDIARQRGFAASTAARAASRSVNQVASISGVGRPLGRHLVLGEDRVDRALGLAGAAVDALVRDR